MAKLNILLQSVFSKLGVDTTSPEAQKLLGNSTLTSIEVGEDISKLMDTDFLTKEAAIQNPEIRSKIRAEALNGVDASLNDLIKGYEFDPETAGEILNQDKTTSKIKKAVEKIEELTRKKVKASSKDTETLNSEIEKLNKQILATKSEYENQLNEVNNLRKTDKINWELDTIYAGFDYSLPAEKNVSITAAKAIISDILNKKGLKFEAGENGVKLLTKENTDYYENNVALAPADFLKKTLLETKMLKMNDMAATTPNQRKGVASNPNPTNAFQRELNQRLNSYEK